MLQAGHILAFGITSALTTYGLLQSYSITQSTKRATAKAPDGTDVSIQEHGDTSSIELTYLPLVTGSGDPAIGTTFTFDGLPWQIDSISDGLTVDGFRSVTVNATWYPYIH